MAVLSKDEARRYRAGKHARYGDECPCGRVVYGNGGKVSHYRRCRVYLEKYGWTFNEGEMQSLREYAFGSTSDLPIDERSDARMRFYHEVAMDEARRRGLIQ